MHTDCTLIAYGVHTDCPQASFIFKNLVPVTLGNIVGGAVCVGAVLCAAYGSGLGKKQARAPAPSPAFSRLL